MFKDVVPTFDCFCFHFHPCRLSLLPLPLFPFSSQISVVIRNFCHRSTEVVRSYNLFLFRNFSTLSKIYIYFFIIFFFKFFFLLFFWGVLGFSEWYCDYSDNQFTIHFIYTYLSTLPSIQFLQALHLTY